jgi:hypothetical protein
MNDAAMPWTLATIVLALAAASPQTAPQITYTEGVVSFGDRGVEAQNGRAEARMPDGSVIHVDRHSRVAFGGGPQIDLHDGRLFIRTTSRGYVDVDLPIARVELTPRGVYGILFNAATETLLVTVAIGHADIRTSSGVTQVVGREMAMMTGAGSRPYATPYDLARRDSFEQWSAQRMTAPAYGPQTPWTTADLAQSGLVVDPPPESSGAPCASWLEWNNPCVGIAPPYLAPAAMPYAPSKAADRAPGDPARDGHELLAPRLGGRGRSQQPAPAAQTPEVKPLPRIVDHTAPSRGAAPPPTATPRPASGIAVSRPRS